MDYIQAQWLKGAMQYNINVGPEESDIWGAIFIDELLRGLWTGSQARLHINVLELMTVWLALKHLAL